MKKGRPVARSALCVGADATGRPRRASRDQFVLTATN